MNVATQMQIHLRLPTAVLFAGTATKLNAVAADGAFGILPNHVDFVTVLVPSILLLTTPDGDERIFGIDEGLLVKHGHTVEISVRRGIESDDLLGLQGKVRESFAQMEDEERVARSALARMEADLVRRFASLRKPHP